MSSQLPLLGHETVSFDGNFSALVHHELSQGAWYEHAPGWLRGHGLLFQELFNGLDWQHTTQHLFDKEVETPRLVASLDDGDDRWPVLRGIAGALSQRYRIAFDRITFAWYRDGNDSVAWHRDRVLRNVMAGYVASVSLGEPRTFQLRPRGGGPSVKLSLGWGDLMVMGGTCQRTWEHTVPKTKSVVGARISVMFRHSAPLKNV